MTDQWRPFLPDVLLEQILAQARYVRESIDPASLRYMREMANQRLMVDQSRAHLPNTTRLEEINNSLARVVELQSAWQAAMGQIAPPKRSSSRIGGDPSLYREFYSC